MDQQTERQLLIDTHTLAEGVFREHVFHRLCDIAHQRHNDPEQFYATLHEDIVDTIWRYIFQQVRDGLTAIEAYENISTLSDEYLRRKVCQHIPPQARECH